MPLRTIDVVMQKPGIVPKRGSAGEKRAHLCESARVSRSGVICRPPHNQPEGRVKQGLGRQTRIVAFRF